MFKIMSSGIKNLFNLCAFGILLLCFGGCASLEIENCTHDNFLNIQERSNTSIVCSGIRPGSTISWSVRRKSDNFLTIVTCDLSKCEETFPPFTVTRSATQSVLFYPQQDTDSETVAEIQCSALLQNIVYTAKCKLNVINPATLSNCWVEEDRAGGSVRASCDFHDALSTSKTIICIWYLQPEGKQEYTRFGTLTTTSTSSTGHRSGTCTYSQGGVTFGHDVYSYSVEFSPGHGRQTVTNAVQTPTLSPSEKPGTPVKREDMTTAQKNVVPTAAIAGGCVGGVLVVVVVVVVVVIVYRRKDQTYAKPKRRRNIVDEHVYADLNTTNTTTTTTTTTTTPTATSTTTTPPPNVATITTTTTNLHNRSAEETLRAVYINEDAVNDCSPRGPGNFVLKP